MIRHKDSINLKRFEIGDQVRVIGDPAAIERAAGRDPFRDCMSPDGRSEYIDLIGFVRDIRDHYYSSVGRRDIYEIEFDDDRCRSFHPEWIEKVSSFKKVNRELDSLFSEAK